jgi:ankyrin repeat protein
MCSPSVISTLLYHLAGIFSHFLQASRPTEELYNAIVKNDLSAVYEKIEAGADVYFVFGPAYNSPEGYTPLMVACHRGRVECAKALLRAGEVVLQHVLQIRLGLLG